METKNIVIGAALVGLAYYFLIYKKSTTTVMSSKSVSPSVSTLAPSDSLNMINMTGSQKIMFPEDYDAFGKQVKSMVKLGFIGTNNAYQDSQVGLTGQKIPQLM